MIRLLGSSWRLDLPSLLKTACLFKMAFLSPCPIQKHNRQRTFVIIKNICICIRLHYQQAVNSYLKFRWQTDIDPFLSCSFPQQYDYSLAIFRVYCNSLLNSGLNAEYTLLLSYLVFLSLVSLVLYLAFTEKFIVQTPVLGSMILLTLFFH